MAENNENLKNFSWDDWSAGEETPIEQTVTTTITEENKEISEEKKETPAEKTEENKDAFDSISFEEDDFSEEPASKENKTETQAALIDRLKNDGLFANLKEEDLKDVSDEDLTSLIDKEIDARIDETFQSFFEEMDEDGMAFLKFKKNGGKTEDFFKTYSSSAEFQKGDISNVEYQKQIIAKKLKADGVDDTEIQDQITYLQDSGKLKNYAEKYEAKLLEVENENKRVLLAQQEEANKAVKEKREALSKTLMETLENNDSIMNLTFNKADNKKLHKYITEPKVKVGKDSYITQLQHDLSETFKNPEKILVLAKILNSGFDFSEIERNLETKITKNTQKKLDGKTNIQKSSSSSLERQKKALHDFFD